MTNEFPEPAALHSDMPPQPSPSDSVALENSDPGNWTWIAKSWVPAEEIWKNLSDMWYGVTDREPATLATLELPLKLDNASSIYIRSCYATIFNTVWAKAVGSEGKNGIIITGQPGTGKTLMNYYFLVRFLQQKQVVIFSPGGDIALLFYNRHVYEVGMTKLAGGAAKLPKPIPSSSAFLWSLFDIDKANEPNRVLVSHPCFPVQTTSLNPERYKVWKKERMPLVIGMPLWTRDELMQGLQLQHRHSSLLVALRKVYGLDLSATLPVNDPLALENFPGARALLNEHFGEKEPESEESEEEKRPSPEDALNYLLDTAIYHFGHSARDVFGAVFDYSHMATIHEDAFDLTYNELRGAVTALSTNHSAKYTISNWILALSPLPNETRFENVRWDVDFKSDWVFKNVIQKLGDAKEDDIREHVSYFQNIPNARGLAGRLLEPYSHRSIANATDGTWPLTRMKKSKSDANAPHFILDEDMPVLTGSNVRFMKVKREYVFFQTIADLSTRLEHNMYCVPFNTSFPLFDSFTVELDPEEKSAILWVLQMSTSQKHGGSGLCYRKIREIVKILKDKLQASTGPPQKKSKTTDGSRNTTPKPSVEVRYLLLVSKRKDEPESLPLGWQFPKGWNENRKMNDHTGDVYRLEVPLEKSSK